MKFLKTDIAPLGMGCWPIGGPFWMGDAPLGYANADDATSIRTIHAALDAGITLFDTAAVYGTGHAERLLAKALSDRPDALIISKIGLAFDEETKQMTGEDADPAEVIPAIDRCLKRLGRDRIDMMLLHINRLPVAQAKPLFDAMQDAVAAGKIRSYGWSTDFPESVEALAGWPDFVAVEHAMNVFFDAKSVQQTIAGNNLTALIRSPLAMGLLTGKYNANSVMQSDDVRSGEDPWLDYYVDAKVNPVYLDRLNAIRELLQTGGRSLTQGALCWLLAKSDRNIPLPGARTPEQITDSAGAVAHGPLPADVMAEIEGLIERPEDNARER